MRETEGEHGRSSVCGAAGKVKDIGKSHAFSHQDHW